MRSESRTERTDLTGEGEGPSGSAASVGTASSESPQGLPSTDFLKLARLGARELEALMLRGDTPDPAALAGWEYRGMNTPFWARPAGIRKFVKGFFRAADGRIFGYNVPVVQNADGEPWIARPRDERPRRFGFYLVERVDAGARDNAYLHALLLDYGRGGNFPLDPTARLRDYVVRVERGSDDLLLGKAYVALGPARIDVRSYFVLERRRPSDFRR